MASIRRHAAMTPGLRARQGPASLFVLGCVFAGCAAALNAGNGAPARTEECRPIGAPDTHTSRNDAGDATMCAYGRNSISNVFDIAGGNKVRDQTGAEAIADTGQAVEPDNTVEDLPAKPQRAAILSRSWRQIFPRTN